jgi:hypothetical protein
MALHWNLSEIKNSDSVCWIKDGDKSHMNPTTETLIWATMIVGLPSISEKDAQEFYWRLRFYEQTQGALRNKWKSEGSDDVEPVYFTADEVRAHIGLGTNASRETRAAWVKRMTQHIDRAVKREWNASPICDGCGKRSSTVEDAGGRVDDGADGLGFCAACRNGGAA